ncbi:MAG TPA: AzlD domain-containing protein [Casimicrobiaceae bacterium]|nr:AzlD domain-containing protein [Casimicrobiaceae bacterium]
MSTAWAWWIVIFVVGALNYVSRLSFIALFAHVEMPPLVARALRYVPSTMLAAIVVPGVVFTAPSTLAFSYTNPKLVAAAVAASIAWRSRSPTATMAGGMVALWLAQWALRG